MQRNWAVNSSSSSSHFNSTFCPSSLTSAVLFSSFGRLEMLVMVVDILSVIHVHPRYLLGGSHFQLDNFSVYNRDWTITWRERE